MKAKKILAALICSSVLIGGAVEAAGNGDVNGDGQVTQADADLLLEYVRGRNVSINRNNADVNGDGTISVADVQGVLNKVRQQQQSGTLRIAYPSNGWYSLQPMCAPNKELTVENASTNKGANVFIWSINSNWHTQPSHQKWYIERVGNSEWYTIKAENSGLALNVDAGIGRDGTNITLWAKTDENQTFRFYDAGNGYYIIQGHTHDDKLFVLDVAAARNQDGTNVHIWHYNQGAPEQKWKLERRNPSTQSNNNSTNVSNENLQNLIRNWTPNKKWDNRESNNIGSTCFGFANYIFRELHGVIAGRTLNWSNAHTLGNLGTGVSCRYSGTVNESSLHNLFQQCKSGDFIQATKSDGTGQHSMIFVSYDSDSRKVRLFDANFTTAHDNLIQDRYSTTQSFAKRFQKVSVYTK